MSAYIAIHVWCSDCVFFQIRKGLNVTPPPKVYWSTDMSTDIWTILDRYIDQHIGQHPLQDTRSSIFTVLVDFSSVQSAWQGSQWRVRTAPYFSHKREIIGKQTCYKLFLDLINTEKQSLCMLWSKLSQCSIILSIKRPFFEQSCLFKSTFLTKTDE